MRGLGRGFERGARGDAHGGGDGFGLGGGGLQKNTANNKRQRLSVNSRSEGSMV
jgi:hypothetical protein